MSILINNLSIIILVIFSVTIGYYLFKKHLSDKINVINKEIKRIESTIEKLNTETERMNICLNGKAARQKKNSLF